MGPENAACSIVRLVEHKKVQSYMKAVLKTVFKPIRWKYLSESNDEVHNLYSNMLLRWSTLGEWDGRDSSMHEMAENTKENVKEGAHFEDVGVNGRIILK
jgi:hypothetical protein